MNKNYKDKLDFFAAHAAYEFRTPRNGRIYISRHGKDLSYSPAYVLSNEDLRDSVTAVPATGKDILTITGSGDQALFYALAGAKHIDTFDISFCAKAIMDTKVAAINHGYTYEQFFNLLNELHYGNSLAEVAPEILKKIPEDSATFIKNMQGYRIFGNGWRPGNYDSENINQTEYSKIQSQNTKDFNFIWSNVVDVHTQLNRQYDIINISNVFEWSPEILVPSIKNLRNSVKPGGHILIQSGDPLGMHRNYPVFALAQATFAEWAKIWLRTKNPGNHIVMLQRIR